MRRTFCIDPSTSTMGVAVIIDVPNLPILRSEINFKNHKQVGLVSHGLIKLKGDVDKRIDLAAKKIEELIELYEITEIFCEDTSHVKQKGARAKEGLAAIKVKIRGMGKRKNIPVYWVSPLTIKAEITNNGFAEKELVIEAVKEVWGITTKDDNHADALAIAYVRVVNGEALRDKVRVKELAKKLKSRRKKSA